MSQPASDFEALFDRMGDAAIIVDASGRSVLASNSAFSRLTGAKETFTAGRMVSEVIGPVQEIAAVGQLVGTACIELKTGDLFPVRLEILPCFWNENAAQLWLVHPAREQSESDLLDYLQEAADQLEVVNRIVAAVNSGRTIEQVFELASQQMRGLISFDRASIALCEEDRELLRVFAIGGDDPGSLQTGAIARLDGSVTQFAIRERRTLDIPDLSCETRFNTYEDLLREGFRSAVCCPLFSNDKAIGSLNLTSRESSAFQRKHLRALERLAPPLAIAIEKVMLLQEAEGRSREMEAAARREELAGRIGRQLTGSLHPALIMQGAIKDLCEGVNASRAHVALFDPADEYVFISYEHRAQDSVPSLRGNRLSFRKSAFASEVLAAAGSHVERNIRERNPDDELLELYWVMDARAVLAAPLTINGERRGVIELHDTSAQRHWTEDDIRLVRAVAAEMSVALTNADLYEASRRRNEEIEGLYRISRVFSTLQDTSDIYGRLSRAIAELVGGEMCLIATYDRRRNEMRGAGPAYNVDSKLVRQFRFTLDTNDERTLIYRTGRPFFSNSPANDKRFHEAFVARYGVRSVLGLPMRIKGELIGFIYVANKPGGFSRQDLRTLEIFAAQATETIANARLFATVQRQAEREAVINRLLLAMQQMSDARQAVDMIVERVADVLDLDRCTAVLFADDDRTEFRGEWCAEGVASVSGDLEVRERSPIPHWLRNNRQPLIASEVRSHSLAVGLEDLIERMDLKSLAVVPIMYQGRVVGALSAQQTKRYRNWAEDDVDLLNAVAAHVGALLENAHLIGELKEANRLKDEFLATLSHELRTPLTAIRGWVELLGENDAVKQDEETLEGVEVIKSSSASLSQLISDLLDLSRIQRRALLLERQYTDVNLVILDATQVVRHSAELHKVELMLDLYESLPLALVDPRRVQQVVWNLVTNAVKFTPKGGCVTVRSRLIDGDGILIHEEDEMRWIAVEVEDNGEGIPANFLPHVWDRFRQADSSSTRRHNGLGIGLTLVKELVEAHGGVVDVRSNGVGATFTIRLPVSGHDYPSKASGFDDEGLPS